MITTIYILLMLATSSSVNAQSMKKILPNDGAASDIFGFSVSIYQNTAVIGAVQDDGIGSAYIFTLDNTTNQWAQTAKLVASDGAFGDDFGSAVSIHQNTAVIGAYYTNDKGTGSGSAYLFTLDNTTNQWAQTAKLVPNDGAAGDWFGKTVSIYQNTVVIGATHALGDGVGSVYIFTMNDTTKQWAQTAKLVASDGAAGDYFGDAVSIYQDTAVIGAGGDSDQGKWSGSVYIFTFDNTTNQWTEAAKLLPNELDGAAWDHFGSAVSIYKNTAVIGAEQDDEPDTNSGSVYIFTMNDTTNQWTQTAKLVANDGAAGHFFGQTVSIYQNTAVIGAIGDDKGSGSGSVYLFTFDNTTKQWNQTAKLVASDGAAGDDFGFSASIYQNTAVIGAKFDNDSGTNSGSAYLLNIRNFASCQSVWDQSTEELLFNHAYTYLIQWEMTQCSFTTSPTNNPSASPSQPPTNNPSQPPTNNPSSTPSEPPTNNPSSAPSEPTNNPSSAPTNNPSQTPTNNPSQPPTNNPSLSPSEPTNNPSSAPTNNPSQPPTNNPSSAPSEPTNNPSSAPTNNPSSSPSEPQTNNQSSAPCILYGYFSYCFYCFQIIYYLFRI